MKAIVLGAGLQGVLVALMLARRGYDVTLIDRRSQIMDGASLNYEGRVHLGLIYAMDRDFATGARMVADALHFAPVVERLIGRSLDWSGLCSTPSRYLVHAQSHLAVDKIFEHFQRVETALRDGLRDERLSYLGQRRQLGARRVDVPQEVCRTAITACFETGELCVDQLALREILRAAIAKLPNITLSLEQNVGRVEQSASGTWDVTCLEGTGQEERFSAPLVLNCLWEERALFDRQIGLQDKGAESMRLKFSLLVRKNEVIDRLGSFIIVHGAFGSIVTHPAKEDAFLSWYPGSLHGLMPVQKLPETWADICRGKIDPDVMLTVWQNNLEGFRTIIPDLGAPEPTVIKAGVILANGLLDIDRTDSAFHRRDEAPVRIRDGYVSVSTGKYTSAPRNTAILEDLLFGGTAKP